MDRYFGASLGDNDPALEAALRSSEAAGLPSIQVSPLQGKLLHLLAKAAGARRILEVGTLGGYSALWLARALPSGGKLVTLEREARHAEIARENLARGGVGDRVEIRLGPALESLERLAAERADPFDLVFVDADKREYPEYLERSIPLCRPGALWVADNVVRRGDVADSASADPYVRGVRQMTEALGRDRRLSATVVQTVGVKGYDGLALAVVTDPQGRSDGAGPDRRDRGERSRHRGVRAARGAGRGRHRR